MKKLIIILFLLPLFGFGQYISNPSYNQDDYAFEFNGTDNVLDLGHIPILDLQSFFVEYSINSIVISNFSVVISNFSLNDKEGWELQQISGVLNFRYWNSSSTLISIPLTATDYSNKIIHIEVEELSVKLYLDNVLIITEPKTAIRYINSNRIVVGGYWRGYYQLGFARAIYFVNINGNIYIPFSIGYSNKIYCVNSGTSYTMQGTTTQSQWITQTDYSYGRLYGVTKVKYQDTIAYIPYLQSGLPLYPSVSPIINIAEKYINYPISYWKPKMIVE